MDLKKMIELMEKLGFYAGAGYFSTDVLFPSDDNSPFLKITSSATGDLIRSPLEPLRFAVCRNNNPWDEMRVARYRTLEECLKREKPDTLAILRCEYDPLEGIAIPEKGKKKLRREIKYHTMVRDMSREIIRCVARMSRPIDTTPRLGTATE